MFLSFYWGFKCLTFQHPLSGEIAMAGKRSIGSLFAKQEVVNRRTRMKKGERTAVRTVLGTHSYFLMCFGVQKYHHLGTYIDI